MDFAAGYVLRAIDQLPKQGDVEPWKLGRTTSTTCARSAGATIDDGALAFR